jgi:hypothetical protein
MGLAEEEPAVERPSCHPCFAAAISTIGNKGASVCEFIAAVFSPG